jgi:hypothetical protein
VPASNELILSICLDDVKALCAEHGVTWTDLYDEKHDVVYELSRKLEDKLIAAHVKLLDAKFGAGQRRNASGSLTSLGAQFTYDTPEGTRKFSPFSFQAFSDEDERKSFPDGYRFGVSLASRYFPVYLDWREKNGTDGNFVLDQTLTAEIDVARTIIAEAVPCFADSVTAVLLQWY